MELLYTEESNTAGQNIASEPNSDTSDIPSYSQDGNPQIPSADSLFSPDTELPGDIGTKESGPAQPGLTV